MPQTPDNNNKIPPEECYDSDEINLIDLIYPIYKRRKFLIVFCLAVTVFVGLISILMPKTYEAKAVILPETSDSDNAMGVKAAFLEQFGVAGLWGTSSTPSAVFGAVLKSKELALDVLRRYDYFYIMGIDDTNKKERTAKVFAGEINVSEAKDNPSIAVSLQSNNPILVSDIANSYVSALNVYNLTKSFSSAQRLREYIEERLIVAEEELDEVQKKLMEFQENNKAVSISKQAEATLNVLAELESQKVALELEKAAKEKFYKGPHIEIEQLEAQIEAVQKNIGRLTYSEESHVPVEREKGKVEFYIPLTKIPSLNYEESKLLLKVKAKTGVITLLTTQLEQSKLDETKDMPTINTLEIAKPPQQVAKPKIKLNLILSFIVSLFLGIIIIFLMVFLKRLERDPKSAPKWNEIKFKVNHILSFKSKFILFFNSKLRKIRNFGKI